jgi:hypothetical protein
MGEQVARRTGVAQLTVLSKITQYVAQNGAP